MIRLPIPLIVVLVVVSGCDPQRAARLEKANADLTAQLKEKDVERNYELEARCSKDARVWFNQSFSRDKDTLLLDFHNHYRAASNQCFALVEYHWRTGVEDTWVNDLSLWNVYENVQIGTYTEEHVMEYKQNFFNNWVITCEVYGSKCTSIRWFQRACATLHEQLEKVVKGPA
jgi:hypothetical protein